MYHIRFRRHRVAVAAAPVTRLSAVCEAQPAASFDTPPCRPRHPSTPCGLHKNWNRRPASLGTHIGPCVHASARRAELRPPRVRVASAKRGGCGSGVLASRLSWAPFTWDLWPRSCQSLRRIIGNHHLPRSLGALAGLEADGWGRRAEGGGQKVDGRCVPRAKPGAVGDIWRTSVCPIP